MGSISSSPKSRRSRNLVSWLQRDIRLLTPEHGAKRAEEMARALAAMEALSVLDWSRSTTGDLFGDDDGLPVVVMVRRHDGKVLDHEEVPYDATAADERYALATMAERNRPMIRRLAAQMKRVGRFYLPGDLVYRANPCACSAPRRRNPRRARKRRP